MLAEFEAVKAHLDGLDPVLRSHLFYATPAPNADLPPVSQVPYVVLESTGPDDPEEASVGADAYREFDLRMRIVTSVADAVPKVRVRVQGRLAGPRQGAVRIPMVGRGLFIEWLGSDVGWQVDRDITFAGTNTHPSYGVDAYRVYSHPA